MGHAPETHFDELEDHAVAFARGLIHRGECADCTCRAMVFAAMALAYETDSVPAIHATLVALLRAMERDVTVAALPH